MFPKASIWIFAQNPRKNVRFTASLRRENEVAIN